MKYIWVRNKKHKESLPQPHFFPQFESQRVHVDHASGICPNCGGHLRYLPLSEDEKSVIRSGILMKVSEGNFSKSYEIQVSVC